MRLLILTLLCSQILVSQRCNSQEALGKGVGYLNIDYIECLEDGMPCDCERSIKTYYSLALDTNTQSKNYGVALSKFEQMEPFIYSIKKTGLNEYYVHNKLTQDTTWAKLQINYDTLFLTVNNKLSKFIQSGISKEFDRQFYLQDNVKLLNESFAKRGYPRLEEIVDNDSLKCDCNKWMGNVNILYVKGKPLSWIIEMIGDSLQIKKIVNIDRDPDDPVQTEKVNSYKWE